MKTTTESDIPELFRQFSGNSANYQELTRAAAARASQARWPLLSAVELEQGDIPAVIDRETGVAVLDTASRQEAAVLAAPAVLEVSEAPQTPAAVPFAVLTEVIPEAAPTPDDILALANNEGVTLTRDEILALTDVQTQIPPENPTPVILPGTNTIFMAPAPFSARHFAQVERALAARREAALAETTATPELAEALQATDAASQPLIADAVVVEAPAVAAETAVVEAPTAFEAPAAPAAVTEAAADNLAALSAELAAAHEEAVVPVTAPAAPLAAAVAAATPAVNAPTLALRSIPATTTAKPAPVQTVPAPLPQAASPVVIAAPTPPILTKATVQAPAPSKAPPPTAAPSDAPAVKHAGLQPLFERLAAPEETATPVMSLFSRLLKS